MPLLLGALPGCHVFEALDIPCVAGEPCGGADDSAAGEVATTGWIVAQTGWFNFFLICTVLALPGMALLLRVAPWHEQAGQEGRR